MRLRRSMSIDSSNIITLVIIIRLVARSMRNHAVSTRDIGSRRILGAFFSAMVLPSVSTDGAWLRARGQACGKVGSDAAVPLVAAVFPVAPVAAAQAIKAGHQLQADDVLGHLVTHLALQSHPQRCAM